MIALQHRRLYLQLAAGCIGIVALAALVAYVRPEVLWSTLQAANPTLLALAVVAYAGFFVLRGARWLLILREAAPATTVAATTTSTAVGWGISTFVPLRAGDVARAAYLARRERAAFPAVLGTVALERAFDVLGIATMCTLGLALLSAGPGAALPGIVGRAVAVAWILPPIGLLALVLIARWWPPHRRTNAVVRLAMRFVDSAHYLLSRPRLIAPVLGLTLLVAAAQSLVFVALLLAFFPATPLAVAIAGAPLFLLSFVITVTPGNVGTYEAAFVAVYTVLGLSSEVLVPVAVSVHLLTMSIVGALAVAALAAGRWTDQPAAAPEPEGGAQA